MALVAVVMLTRPSEPMVSTGVRPGQTAPDLRGTTLDGQPFDLADLRGRPVIVNFWGPSCVPCRDEFPLLKQKLTEHAADGLQVVGVLTDDPVDPARSFVADQGATWPTVVDPGAAIKAAYRVIGRPQSYFIDRSGVVRFVQVGQIATTDFESSYALIRGEIPSPSVAP